MKCSRHDGWNHPIRIYFTFSQTQLVEMVTWQVQYVTRQGFRFSLSSYNANEKLLTACQHSNHDITCLSDLPIYKCHSQLRQSCCPNLSCDQFSQSCSAGGKVAPEVCIVPHKIIVTCVIIFCSCGLKKNMHCNAFQLYFENIWL